MKTAALVTTLLLGLGASAQNLVPNGSFEEYYNCPTIWGQWMQVQHWISPYNQSADYFNACTGDTVAGVPFNQFGYQHASDGQAYMGVFTYSENAPTYREMIQTELFEPLVPGTPVCLSFRMAIGGFGSWGFINSARFTSTGVGMKFFRDLPTNWLSYLYPNTAALYMDVLPTDTAIWYTLSGEYTPDSAYTHLVIANFFADSLTEVSVLDSTGWGLSPDAYAFIDDVRVSFDLSFCDLSGGTPDHGTLKAKVFPNPFSERLEVACDEWPGKVVAQLLDGTGRSVVEEKRITGDRVSIDTRTLKDGIYLLRVSDAHGATSTFRVAHVTP